VKVVSREYIDGPLSLYDQEQVRKAIRDVEKHAQTKAAKADEVYQLVLTALPAWVRQAFPGIETYLKLY
jgi:hypothetical protein